MFIYAAPTEWNKLLELSIVLEKLLILTHLNVKLKQPSI